jgi:hypothetical protein
MSFRSGGDPADHQKGTPDNVTMQELAAAGPSAIESYGPEPNGPVVRVEFVRYDGQPQTFKLRCGLYAAGGGL